MGDVPAAPTGFTRYLMKSKFGAGRDFAVLDPDTEAQLFFVDGKLGPRPKAEVQGGDGSVLYSVKGQLLGIPKKMSITDAAGTEVAAPAIVSDTKCSGEGSRTMMECGQTSICPKPASTKSDRSFSA